ncbi:MAG TPA: hypothetical protein VM598_09080 [Bdellovibrionota bacterium]|nr:hypothetical protein [Bdellovibrionota bacterium]
MHRVPPVIKKVSSYSAWTSILCALWLGAIAQADPGDEEAGNASCGCAPETECRCDGQQVLPTDPIVTAGPSLSDEQ